MKKSQKTMLVFAIVGTLVILGMAFVDRWLYPDPLPPGLMSPTSAPVEVDVQENESKPEDMNEAEVAPEEVLPEAGVTTFRIASSKSEVRFTLDEILAGVPTTVVGLSNQVTGDFSLGLDDSQNVRFGEILVDVRTLMTDKSFRNRAIANQILDSNTYQFISFLPKEASPLPGTITFGDAISLEIIGDLTIKGVTQEVTFNATLTPLSETEIEGHAEVMLTYADYGINIPSVPKVADVDEEVLLEIDFVALAE
jgi:polyisoprenoid-binding protein YceI